MKKLIRNTILVVVVIFLGLFLSSCEKDNVEPIVDNSPDVITVDLGMDWVTSFEYYVVSGGEYKVEPTSVTLMQSITNFTLPVKLEKGDYIAVETREGIIKAVAYNMTVRVKASPNLRVIYQTPKIIQLNEGIGSYRVNQNIDIK